MNRLGSEDFGPCGQLRHADAKPFRQADHVVPAWVAAAVLDVADPALHEAGRLGKLDLADATFVADGQHCSTEAR